MTMMKNSLCWRFHLILSQNTHHMFVYLLLLFAGSMLPFIRNKHNILSSFQASSSSLKKKIDVTKNKCKQKTMEWNIIILVSWWQCHQLWLDELLVDLFIYLPKYIIIIIIIIVCLDIFINETNKQKIENRSLSQWMIPS